MSRHDLHFRQSIPHDLKYTKIALACILGSAILLWHYLVFLFKIMLDHHFSIHLFNIYAAHGGVTYCSAGLEDSGWVVLFKAHRSQSPSTLR